METRGNHPERAAGRVCMKHPVHFCEQCACRRDPKRYRKHHTACVIRFVVKKESKLLNIKKYKSNGIILTWTKSDILFAQ